MIIFAAATVYAINRYLADDYPFWALPVAGICALFFFIAAWLVIDFMYAAMIVFLAGMICALQMGKSKNALWGRPAAVACGFVALLFAAISMAYNLSSCRGEPEREIREEIHLSKNMQYLGAGMQYLGNYLARNYPNHKVLLITNPVDFSNKKQRKLIMESLLEGFAGKLSIVATEHEPASTSAASKGPGIGHSGGNLAWLTTDSFDRLIAKPSDCDLIISLAGLPYHPHQSKFFQPDPENASERPKLVAPFHVHIRLLKKYVKAGVITASIVPNPAYSNNTTSEVPADYVEAFQQRYVLVDAENIDQVIKMYPQQVFE